MSALDVAELTCHPSAGADVASLTLVATGRLPVVALVGRPNVGKSTFFARATGRYAETSNLPGTTVGTTALRVEHDGEAAILVDLPGAHSLTDRSDGLPAFWEQLSAARPDAILSVVDAGDLARHLPLTLACRDLGLPIVVAANLADEAAAHGIELDAGRLSQLLVAPVHRTVGRKGIGVDAAVGDAIRLASRRAAGGLDADIRARPAIPYPAEDVRAVAAIVRQLSEGAAPPGVAPELAASVTSGRLSPTAAASVAASDRLESQRWAIAARWAGQVERRRDVPAPLADRVARLVTAPWPGLPLFALVTLASLGLTMVVGTLLSNLLASVWSTAVSPVLTGAVHAVVPVPPLAAALLWALDSGLLSMLSVGIPFVLSFYLILAVLEDSGYLTAAAVLADRLFNTFGLPGRAAIPILAATGCNVPAVYGTRVLDSRRERLLATFLVVLTPCSARTAVVIAAIAPFAGPGVALAAFGVVALISITAGVGANALVPGRQTPLALELSPLRAPIARQVALKAWFRFRSFVRTATPVMLAGSFILGLAYESGAIGPLEALIGPAAGWLLGLPAVAGIALVLAFLRKELAIQLLLVLAIAEYGAGASSLSSFLSSGQLFVYAVATAVSIPCVATLATLVDEFGRKAAAGITLATLCVGLGGAAILARLLGVA